MAKIHGEFDWHSHADEDEMFLVVKGDFEMHLRDEVIPLQEGEFLIVPRGVEHKPVAKREAHIMLFEAVGTVNTGDQVTNRTVLDPEQI